MTNIFTRAWLKNYLASVIVAAFKAAAILIIMIFYETYGCIKKVCKLVISCNVHNQLRGLCSSKFTIQKEVMLFVAILGIFLLNSTYISYADEFVNILGGKFLLMGKWPYQGFFDHHLPIAWFIAAFLLIISFGKYVFFRLWWAIFSFCILAVVGQWIRKNNKDLYPYYLIFFGMYPLMSVFFWFHLYLADSLAVLFFSSAFWILISQTINEKIHFKAILIASFLIFCLVFSSLAFIYLASILYAWLLYLVFRTVSPIKHAVRLITFIVVPYILYLVFTLMTGTVKDFWFANFFYNTSLYIDIGNYTRGAHFNPLKFALTLIFNFHANFFPLLTGVKFLDLYNPSLTLAAVGIVTLLILLFIRSPVLGVLFFFLLSFSAPRSNVQKLSETDYQISLFVVLGLISAVISLYLLQHLQKTEHLSQDVKRVVHLLLITLLFFTFLFMSKNTYEKAFLRYTQVMPSIANVSFTANVLNKIVHKGDYFWIGPYEPDAEFFVKQGMLPGKYPTLLPQFRENEYLKTSFIQQFEDHPPQYIVLKSNVGIFGTPIAVFGKFFIDWMKDKYQAVGTIKNVEVLYNTPNTFIMSSDLYIKKDNEKELLKRLQDNGYITLHNLPSKHN